MSSQNALNDNGAQNKSLLVADGETDSETRRIHARTRGAVNATVVEIVDASGAQITTFGSSTVTANQGTAAADSGHWPVQLIDDSNAILDLTSGGQTGVKVMVVGDGDKYVRGTAAHDASASGIEPVLVGGYASAAAPTSVSADGDAVNAWLLRNGAQATVLTAAGALVGGDATNGLDVDVTRLSALVAGSAIIGKVTTDQTTHGTTDLVAADITKIGGNAVNTETTGEIVIRPQVKLSGILRTTQSVTATTSTAATNFGATSSKRNYITGYSIWNSSATDVFVRLQDGSGGSDFWVIPAPKGGGSTVSFETPIPQPTTNTALYFAESASASTVYVSLVGFQAA